MPGFLTRERRNNQSFGLTCPTLCKPEPGLSTDPRRRIFAPLSSQCRECSGMVSLRYGEGRMFAHAGVFVLEQKRQDHAQALVTTHLCRPEQGLFAVLDTGICVRHIVQYPGGVAALVQRNRGQGVVAAVCAW